jgi:uncharacterized protein (TIGR02466 family)
MIKLKDPKVHPLFSVPVYETKVEGYKNDVIDFDNIPYHWFNKNPIQSNTFNSISQNILEEPGFLNLKNLIDSLMEEYVYNQLKLPRSSKLKLVNSWMVIGHPGSETNGHTHPNSVYSGIFYLKAGPGTGVVKFSIPRNSFTFTTPTVSPMPTEFNLYNSLCWGIEPGENTVLIFPSHLEHSITKNISNRIRCCVPFNYFLVEEISSEPTQVLYL